MDSAAITGRTRSPNWPGASTPRTRTHWSSARVVEALRVKYPGAEPLVIRGTLAALAKAGKVNPHAEDTAAELAKVLPVIAAESITPAEAPQQPYLYP